MKKRSLQLSLKLQVYAGFIGLLLSGLPPQLSAAPDAKIIEAARKEGQLMWYNTLVQPHAQEVINRFMQKYPFVRATFSGAAAIEYIPGCQPRPEQDDTNGMSFR